MLYLDTSVLVAYYIPEPNSAKVQRILSRQSRTAISPLVEIELHSALGRKARSGQLDLADARKAAGLFAVHLADGLFDIVPVAGREYRIARDWIGAFSTPLRTLDALHLAAAFCNGLTLLTADAALARSAKALGVDVKLI